MSSIAAVSGSHCHGALARVGGEWGTLGQGCLRDRCPSLPQNSQPRDSSGLVRERGSPDEGEPRQEKHSSSLGLLMLSLTGPHSADLDFEQFSVL